MENQCAFLQKKKMTLPRLFYEKSQKAADKGAKSFSHFAKNHTEVLYCRALEKIQKGKGKIKKSRGDVGRSLHFVPLAFG